MDKLVRITFGAIFATMITYTLWVFLFGFSGASKTGAIYYAYSVAETPISIYYDRYCRQPNELWDSVDNDSTLNSSVNVDTADRENMLEASDTLEAHSFPVSW